MDRTANYGTVFRHLSNPDRSYRWAMKDHLLSRKMALSRRKRDLLFPSGVKLCSHETVQQAIQNHLNYFHLRVCQETIWEAFKIFWDRLPEKEEYQIWMRKCQNSSVSVFDISRSFSQSAEHLALISSVSILVYVMTADVTIPHEELDIVSESTLLTTDRNPEDSTSGKYDYDIPTTFKDSLRLTRPVGDHIVELSIKIRGESFDDALRDPSSYYYQYLSELFIDKIEEVFKRLPGFKKILVLEFRGLAVVVHYAVVLEGDGVGISKETMDYINLHSNMVENSFTDPDELPTVVYTITDFRNYITEALHRENFIRNTTLEVDPDSLQLENGRTFSKSIVEEEGFLQTATTISPITGTITVVALPSESPHKLEEIAVSPVEPPDVELTTQSDLIDLGSGSGFSGDHLGPDIWPWESGTPEEVLKEDEVHQPQEDQESIVEQLEPPHQDLTPEEPFLDRVLVTQDIRTNPHYTTTDQAPVFWTMETLTVELSMQTQVAPEQYEDYFPDESTTMVTHVTSQPSLYVYTSAGTQDVDASQSSDTISSPADKDYTERRVTPTVIPPSTAVAIDEQITSTENKQSQETLASTTKSNEMPSTTPLPVILELDTVSVEGIIELPALLWPEVEESDEEVKILDEEMEVIKLMPTENPVTELSEEDLAGDEILVATTAPTTIATEEPSVDHSASLALIVFFSLRVTNMMFSEDLFNKSSTEYKALEQQFMELLVPYLQSNLSNFQNLEILNFRNGSIVVNSRMKFGKPVPHGVTTTVYLILENFCNTAYQTMNLAIDKYSLDVESGDQADPCKFQACNEFSQCLVNRWSGEAECVCNAGYFSVDGLPCQSICDIQEDFCQNDGKCDIIPGKGAICRCRVGENWWYRGGHCEEYVSEPLVVGIAIASVAGFLLVASGVIFFLARTLRDQCDTDDSEDPLRYSENMPSLERATKYNPMFESEATTGYKKYYRRYPDTPAYSTGSAETSTDFSSEEIRHVYENSELTKEEIQDRIRIIELYAKDRQFADFVRQHQV
uniref:Interphotoreceptor matrix proteoglycan 2 n=1 Tax=Sinocyclocheilus rhinocerous TaxID=307959 RepID=A0A673GJ62_9TELE